MDFDQIDRHLKALPFIYSSRARSLYDFVIENECRDILELGFAHGKSSCYLAAAVQELGSGSVLTIDLETSRSRSPNIETLLEQTGLSDWVQPVYATRSFTWELMKVIESATVDGRCRPRFDFCFLDAGHTWDTTGFGFFLVEKLLKPGGWLLFDDLRWTMASSRNSKCSGGRPPNSAKTRPPQHRSEKYSRSWWRRTPNLATAGSTVASGGGHEGASGGGRKSS